MSLRVRSWLTSLEMFPHHCAHFLLPLFFSSSPPSFIHLQQCWNAVSQLPDKVPVLISPVGVCVFVCFGTPGQQAQWTRQGSEGVRCESVCERLAARQFLNASSANSRGRRGAVCSGLHKDTSPHKCYSCSYSQCSQQANPGLKGAFNYKCPHPSSSEILS